MANAIDLVVGNDVSAQLANLIAELRKVDTKLSETSLLAIKLSGDVSRISTPTGGSGNAAANEKLLSDLKKQEAQIKSLHETISAAAEKSRLSEIRLDQAREKAFDSYEAKVNKQIASNNRKSAATDKANASAEKQAQKEEALANKMSSAYNKTQAQLNRLTAVYNDLSVRKERYNNLTENEQQRLSTLTRVNEKYNGVLRNTDAAIGKNSRNVGNYASGWNGLSNSINQLTREAPAFANSMQTGFMAISNNIPILVDEINNLNLANKKLVEGGGKAKNVLTSIAGALFSWQTALSLGVTLLTIYGAKIVDFVMNVGAAEKAQLKFNKSVSDSRNTITSEISNIESLVTIILDHNKTSEARRLAYEEIRKTLPGLTSETYAQAISIGELTKATDLYISSLIQQSVVETEAKEIAEEQTRINKLSKQSFEERLSFTEKFFNSIRDENLQQKLKPVIEKQQKDELNSLQKSLDERKQVLVKSQEEFLKTSAESKVFETKLDDKSAKDALKKEEDRLRNLYELRNANLELDLQRIDVNLENENIGFRERLLLLIKDNEKRKEIIESDNLEAVRLAKGNDIELLIAKTSYYSKQEELLVQYNKKRIDIIQKQVLLEYKEEKAVIEELKKAQEEIIATKKIGSEQDSAIAVKSLENSKARLDELEKLKEATDNWLNSFSAEFLQNSGMGSLTTFFDGTFAKILEGAETNGEKFAVTFNAMAEVAQDAFNRISQASQANFDGEYKRLESQKDIALKFAGESDFAKKQIEDQYETRRKEIVNRENKAKKEQAIFNIAIDTAQAIMATLARGGAFAIPLSIVVGALGAVQIAAVAAQKIPEFFEGGTHDGGLMMVNDAKGSNYKETIVTPDGKIIKPEGRDVVMNAPKGTQIFTPEQWQEKELHNMLQSKGISMNESHHSNSGLTYQEMDAILGKHFKNITTQTTTFDKKGFSSYSVSKGNKTIRNENRASGQGFKV